MTALATLERPNLILNPFASRPEARALREWNPRTDLGRAIRDAVKYLPAELANELIERVQRIVVLQSRLSGVVFRGDGRVEHLGLLSQKVITTAGVTYLCADMAAGASDINLFKFHGFGSGSTAEASGDTALVTEYTTQYATDNTRPTGSQVPSTNTYTSVGTFSPDASVTVAEHGLFSQAATGGGTLWDRSLTGSVALTGSADSLQATYVLTASAGG